MRLATVVVAMAMGAGLSAVRADEPVKPPPSIWERPTLTGDWGGARTTLANKGIEITINYIGEVFDVISGGLARRASYEGLLDFSVDTDLQKMIGWTGASTHVTVYQIHNSGSNVGQNVGSLGVSSNIDAVPATRLFTAWFQQSFGDFMSVQLGQLATDADFIGSVTASGLLNGTFAWADIVAANLTNGGPAYPLATPGARLVIQPSEALTLQTAVYSGDPAGKNCFTVPQECNKHGTTFSFAGGTLWMGEAQYAINRGKNAAGLPGVYKLGVWYATADYADQHYGIDATGATVSLGVDTTATPIQHHGNWGVYGVVDQMVWRGGDCSLNLFVRAGAAPSDRNLLSFYIDGGAAFTGLVPGLPNDVLTFGVAYAKISSDAAAADQDAALFAPPYPVRDHEVVFELSYAMRIAPWWTMQPDLQVIVHPGGNVPDPNDPHAAPAKDTVIAGIRSTIKF